MNKKPNITRMVHIALLIALEITLSRFLGITTPIVKISFAFLPIAAVAILYGPFYSALAGALGDFVGALLFPVGAYFPGFTLTAGLVGLVYGIFLYKKNNSYKYILTAAVIVSVFLHLGLDTYWINVLTGKGFLAILPARILKCVIMIPVQTLAIKYGREKLLDNILKVSAV
ncbi:MAG: folate family ECF transporter S component [Oscillospiraceae bacterium]